MKKILLGLLVISVWGCSDKQGNLDSNESGELLHASSAFDINKYPINKLVCDPFSENSNVISYQSGLTAELFYLSEGQTRFNDVQSYIDQGQASDQNLFFETVEVATRLFDSGFPLESGGLVTRDDGEVLEEYFALKFRSNLHLSDVQEDGYYEFALLSDDGAILQLSQNDEQIDLVDNDGDHPTRLGCGQTLFLRKGELYPIQLSYYQGPRFHISVIPLWRKVDSLNPPRDPLCGVKGNRKYFDFDNDSEPQQGYLDLLARGWRPIGADNYKIPDESAYNPCVDGQKPVISEFYVFDNLDGGLIITFETDIPASGQVLYTYSSQGTANLTSSDNLLRTQHRVTIPAPSNGDSVIIRAVAISETLGKTVSSGKIFRSGF